MTFEIPLFKVRMSPDVGVNVDRVLHSGHIAQGPEVDSFESELAAAIGTYADRVVTVNSGTSALHLAYHLALWGRERFTDHHNDPLVIATPMTCAATIAPLVHMGARIVWADVDPITGNIDPFSVARIFENAPADDEVAAIVAVDWAGVPANIGMLRDIDSDVAIIEDAAHAFGASTLVAGQGYQSIASRAIHDDAFVAYSFQAIKHLTTGDGGALVCPTVALADRARRLRWFGLDRKSKTDFRCEQDIVEAGYKFHMNDIAAAIGRVNLPGAMQSVVRHREIARRYHDDLGDLAPRVQVACLGPFASYWVYTLIVDDRESFQAWMHERGIQTSQVHRRNDLHPAFPAYYLERPGVLKVRAPRPGDLPGLDYFSARQVSIPCGWWMDATDIQRVIDAVLAWAKR